MYKINRIWSLYFIIITRICPRPISARGMKPSCIYQLCSQSSHSHKPKINVSACVYHAHWYTYFRLMICLMKFWQTFARKWSWRMVMSHIKHCHWYPRRFYHLLETKSLGPGAIWLGFWVSTFLTQHEQNQTDFIRVSRIF